MTEYTNKDIGRITGISTTKVHYFVDQGVIIPAERVRGRSVVYTERNLVEVMMAIVMQEQGMSLSTIKETFEMLRAVETKEKITDFFTGDKWGREKDIMVAMGWVDSYPRVVGEPGVRRKWGDIVDIDYKVTDELQERVLKIANGPITLVPIGKIKNQAIDRLKF